MTRDAGSRAPGPDARERLRSLPSVEELAGALDGVPHALAVRAAREAIAAGRELLMAGAPLPDMRADALARVAAGERPSLRRVLNATGVIVHTNLGRAPLPPAALDAIAEAAAGYSTLEYDTGTGARGSRHVHVEGLLRELTGAEAAIAVNNCASAVLLAAAALAGGRELVVSRGQLVEIGGSFRIPDVVAQSGARLVEVGTTNRTRIADYERALGPDTGAVMRAHQSNFRTVGFVQEVEIEALCEAAARAGVPVIDDVGSGALAERLPELADEPPVRRSVAAGCALTCFSGDKLLGGPQAGLIVGTAGAVERCRSHPLARAVRIDKLSLAALEATLRLYLDPARALREVPVLRMLAAAEDELRTRAEAMRSVLLEAGVEATVLTASAKVGGGSLPLLELEGPVCAVDPGSVGADELARRLRDADPPVVARAREGWLLLDPRTLDDAEARAAAESVAAALA
ncbi:MAG: L-seryl-tRNA(Ser) seleniumtransferase [Thermoleophilaceae bacterium]|nr:L-seryl-tRNA(Ser) seleniumtransferase [Thermoleophilaceae bacterium]